MHWNSFSEFAAMGGYAVYVWGSFGVTALALAVEASLLRLRRKRAIEALRSSMNPEGAPS